MIDVETIFDSDREEYEFMKEKEYQTMNETKLKPCPFCGGKARLLKDKTTFTFADTFYVLCDNIECGVKPQTWHRLAEQEAIDFWNRRANDERADCGNDERPL